MCNVTCFIHHDLWMRQSIISIGCRLEMISEKNQRHLMVTILPWIYAYNTLRLPEYRGRDRNPTLIYAVAWIESQNECHYHGMSCHLIYVRIQYLTHTKRPTCEWLLSFWCHPLVTSSRFDSTVSMGWWPFSSSSPSSPPDTPISSSVSLGSEQRTSSSIQQNEKKPENVKAYNPPVHPDAKDNELLLETQKWRFKTLSDATRGLKHTLWPDGISA